MRSAVVLPQPEGPTSTTNSPSRDLEVQVVDRNDPVVVDLRECTSVGRQPRTAPGSQAEGNSPLHEQEEDDDRHAPSGSRLPSARPSPFRGSW